MKTLKEYLDEPGGKEQLENEVDKILGDFDFKKVERVMDCLSWFWYIGKKNIDIFIDRGNRTSDDGMYYIPKEKDLLFEARKIIMDTIDSYLEAEKNGEDLSSGWGISTAGFWCRVSIVDDETRKYYMGEDAEDNFENSVDIKLKFVIAENFGKFV